MLRVVLILLLIAFLARAFWRIVDGVLEGLTGVPRSGRPPVHRVQMMRDPVCGTFVVPDRALMISDGATKVYFCSTKCRDQYRARTA